MVKYTEKFFKDFNITSDAKTPATSEFMKVDESSPPTSREKFASQVMTIFYMAMRTRPDVLVYAAILATRISDARVHDAEKLNRLARFIHATRYRGIVLRFRGNRVVLFVDASYNLYHNSRSQTGIYFTICDDSEEITSNGTFFVRSLSQKVIGRSSFDAEWIALDTSKTPTLFIRDVISDLGIDQISTLVMEDNEATIVSARQGDRFRGKTSHIRVRVHSYAQLIEAGVVDMRHCLSENQVADPLTKPMFTRRDLYSLMRVLNDYGYVFGDPYDEAAMSEKVSERK
jgi:hypothetical protein